MHRFCYIYHPRQKNCTLIKIKGDEVYSQKLWELEVVLVEFVFSMVWQLPEASLDDEGLLDHTLQTA